MDLGNGSAVCYNRRQAPRVFMVSLISERRNLPRSKLGIAFIKKNERNVIRNVVLQRNSILSQFANEDFNHKSMADAAMQVIGWSHTA
jgi:hypothetical protein